MSWGTHIKAALDAGADGVIVPQVRCAEEVRTIVADCRYPTGKNMDRVETHENWYVNVASVLDL